MAIQNQIVAEIDTVLAEDALAAPIHLMARASSFGNHALNDRRRQFANEPFTDYLCRGVAVLVNTAEELSFILGDFNLPTVTEEFGHTISAATSISIWAPDRTFSK